MTFDTETPSFKELSSEEFNKLIDGDYPQFGPNSIYMMLSSCDTDEAFYERVDSSRIHTVDEYVDKKLEPNFGLTKPNQPTPELQDRINTINRLVSELKSLVDAKASRQKLYDHLMTITQETGIIIPSIEKYQ